VSRGPLSVTRLLGPGTEVGQLREALREVVDPELGIDIVSLGLVYGLEVSDPVTAVVLSTTTPACPLGEYITDEVRHQAKTSPRVGPTGGRGPRPWGCAAGAEEG
jgi:Iron-sulfur cluster assembly protein